MTFARGVDKRHFGDILTSFTLIGSASRGRQNTAQLQFAALRLTVPSSVEVAVGTRVEKPPETFLSQFAGLPRRVETHRDRDKR